MSRAAGWLKELLFPRRCMLCRDFLKANETDLCRGCRTNAPEYPFGAENPDPSGKNSGQFLDSFTAVWYYEEDVRRSILRYKFRRATFLGPKFGTLLAMKLLRVGPGDIDLLTWVPVSPLRRFRRGYDQCQLLCKAMGEQMGIPAERALRKIRHTPPQSGLHSVSERKANVLGAYKAVKQMDLRGKRVVLVDDIYTTGSTMNECARVLLTAGAKEVHGAAIAAVRYQKK